MFSNNQLLKLPSAGMLLLLLILLCGSSFGQGILVRGRVTDKSTGAPLPYVNVFIPGTSKGTNTDVDGGYQLLLDSGDVKATIRFSFLGYKAISRPVSDMAVQTIVVTMEPDNRTLNEVVVRSGKRKKYRNRNNPAVELIRNVIAHKADNKLEHYDFVQYKLYEKVMLSLSNTPEKLRRNRLFKKYDFIMNSLDTTTIKGKALMPLYLEENSSEVFYRSNPEKKKTVVSGEKQVSFSDFIDNQGLKNYVQHIYQDIDIYKANVTVLTNQFLSPIADIAPAFYEYFIIDTIRDGDTKLIKLSFAPRNKGDFLFQGDLYIVLDSSYAVSKVDMQVNKNINLNWVKELHISQQFSKLRDGHYQLAESELSADFGISKNSAGGIYGKRTVSLDSFVTGHQLPDSIYQGVDRIVQKNADRRTDSFWTHARHDTLTTAETNVYRNIDSLQKTKSFKRKADILTLVLAGYKRAGNYVEIGPVNTFYSFNPVEGLRLRLGGRTTPALSKSVYFESYTAYGFKDQKWKYYLGGIYSITGRSIYEFPVKAFHANYQQDTKIPGQELQFVEEDNFLLSFKRGVNDKWLYNNIYNLDFLDEFPDHFSFRINYKNWKQQAAGGLQYISDLRGNSTLVKDIVTSELGLELRWAPKEEFYQGKQYRIPIFNKYPVFTLRTTLGSKGLAGGQYNYQSVTLNIYKHVYLSQLGYSDITLEGGNTFGRVPFPLLDIHRANQTYSYQLAAYNLMNFLEFVSDHYAGLNIDHCFNGFILNKIPLVKKLKFREYADIKVLYGGLRNENTPAGNSGLLKLPTDPNGNPTTFTLNNKPYIEGSVGIGNILKFFRIDVVRRFTYLDLPHVSQMGIRGRFKFDF